MAITTISLNMTAIPKPLHYHAVFESHCIAMLLPKLLHCYACCCQSYCTAMLLEKPLLCNTIQLLKPALHCYIVELCLFIFILILNILFDLTWLPLLSTTVILLHLIPILLPLFMTLCLCCLLLLPAWLHFLQLLVACLHHSLSLSSYMCM